MIKFVPTYVNFQYLNGDSASFDEDAKFVFVLMPFGRTDNEKKKFGDVFWAIQRVVEKACFHGDVLSCSRADLENDLIIMDSVCQKIGSIEEFVGKFRWEEGKEQEEGV